MNLSKVDGPFQWQIVRIDLDPVEGSEQSGLRPALVISREAANASLPVLVVLPITTRKAGRRIFAGEVLLSAGCAGLPHESIAMCQQIRTISKTRIIGTYGRLLDEELREMVRQTLRDHLDLAL